MTELTLKNRIMLDAGVIGNPKWQGQRITQMLNDAQYWLQMKLIKQGYKNWKTSVAVSVTPSTLLGKTTTKFTLPSDFLYDMPIDFVTHDDYAKPVREVKYNDFFFVANNSVLVPTVNQPVFVMVDKTIHLFPALSHPETQATVHYTKRITDLIYNNDIVHSEIATELQNILIERVVMQIKSALGAEDIKQAKRQEIDAYLAEKYQLDSLKAEDRKVSQ